MDAPENLQNKKAPPGYPWLERELMLELGVSLRELGRIRGKLLARDIHWVKFKRRVCLNHVGYHIVVNYLGLTPKIEPGDNGNGTPVVTLRTTAHKTLNPHIIVAVKPSEPTRLLRVRVKTKEKFRPGMTIQARQGREGGADYFELVGNCPRYVGKF